MAPEVVTLDDESDDEQLINAIASIVAPKRRVEDIRSEIPTPIPLESNYRRVLLDQATYPHHCENDDPRLQGDIEGILDWMREKSGRLLYLIKMYVK